MKYLMENWRRYLKEGDTIALGKCYPFANRMAMKWSDDNIDKTKHINAVFPQIVVAGPFFQNP